MCSFDIANNKEPSMSDSRSGLSQGTGGNPPALPGHAREAFVVAWQAGARRSIESFVNATSDSARLELFRELLLAEFSLRRRAGETPLLEDYQSRFPEFRDFIEGVFRESPTVHAVMAATPTPTTSWHFAGTEASVLPQIPGYEILQQLAPGGMGVVFRARDLTTGQNVALKMIRSGIHADAQERARFRLESEAIASLAHPNIVKIFVCGVWEGMPYLAMEFAAGGSLAQLLESGPIAFDRAIALLEILALATQFIHEREIIHRDLKPANVLISADGAPKLADFGLAKRLDFDQGLTQTQAILGTASYMAPEQAAGPRQGLGPGVDIYALGAILYELLTGRPPFLAETRELTIHQVLSQEPRRPSLIRSGISPGLEAICLKCLEKDATRRFASARALAEELTRLRSGVGLSIRTDAYDRRRRAAQRVGYEILEALEPEGTCSRYRGRQTALNRTDVVEIFAGATQFEPVQLDTLRIRSETLAQLHHQHIVEIYSFGELDGEWFVAREYVAGAALTDHWPEPLGSPDQAAAIVEALARAVHQAHMLGIVHGRLKPAKVIVGADGQCKLIGFAPTPAAAVESDIMDDIAGLGTLLFQLLHGRAPDAVNQGTGSPESAVEKRTGLRGELEAVCRKCLERDVARGYPNAAALAEDLRRARAGEVLLIDDLDEWAQQQRWARRAGYRILELLGQNQNGFTYKARHLEHDRHVVLKRISARFRFVPAAKERFRLEGRLLESLKQPSIARVFDQGEQNDLVYFAREYVEGSSLAERISTLSSRLTSEMPSAAGSESAQIREGIRLCRMLASAIHHAHSANVIHGGLNPTSVHLTPGGAPKITSFRRISFSSQSSDDPLAELERYRLAAYVAPEMREGRRRRAERSADIYSLGAILHALLTGQPPVPGLPALAQFPVSSSASDLPVTAATICRRCLDPNPANRYATAAEVVNACGDEAG
jgi:serine/threonine protein kinase